MQHYSFVNPTANKQFTRQFYKQCKLFKCGRNEATCDCAKEKLAPLQQCKTDAKLKSKAAPKDAMSRDSVPFH